MDHKYNTATMKKKEKKTKQERGAGRPCGAKPETLQLSQITSIKYHVFAAAAEQAGSHVWPKRVTT